MKPHPADDQYSLRWFRDQGRGQEAADVTGADQIIDVWPQAVLPCTSYEDSEVKWRGLLNRFGVNAMTYAPFIRS